MYKCEIIADSLSPQENRLTSFLVTYPRIVHAEMLRHRMFSRNVASSRAIPFKKMVKDIEENPFIPIAWQKDHKGMQGDEYYDITLKEEPGGLDYTNLPRRWLRARDTAVSMAKALAESQNMPVTKQLCNRLLEPFMWVTEIITGTEWDNFFDLRCPKYDLEEYGVFKSKKQAIEYINGFDASWLKDYSNLKWLKLNQSQAEIHIQAIAEMMWDAYNESTPKKLESGEWHIPYGDNIDLIGIAKLPIELSPKMNVKIATARAARLSYQTLGDNPKIDYEADIKLHDKLLADNHMSPFEHCARAMTDKEYQSFIKGARWFNGTVSMFNDDSLGWCRNFRGFIQYRHLVEI